MSIMLPIALVALVMAVACKQATSGDNTPPDPKPVALENLTITIPASSVIGVGKKLPLEVTYTPKNATDKTVTWKSDKEGVATVDATGKVTGVSAGTANITVTSKSNKNKNQTLEVTVKPVTTSIAITKHKDLNNNDKTVQLVATPTPAQAHNKFM